MSDEKIHVEDDHQYDSPSSTLSSGFGDNGGFHHEDNLPEVRPDNSPQALSPPEALFKKHYFDDQEPKYPVVYDDTPKTAVFAELSPWESPSTSAKQHPVPKERKMCGIRRKRFIIGTVILLVITAIAVGAGVGLTMNAKKTASPQPIQFLNNQTVQTNNFSFQGFSEFNYLGEASPIIDVQAGTNFNFSLNSYVWIPQDTWCCLSFCQKNQTTKISPDWRCSPRYQNQSSNPFDRIFIWCGENQTNSNAICFE